MKEQISQNLENYFSKNFDNLTKALSLFSLPFISDFKVLMFSGIANGTDLTNRFDNSLINGKSIVIKGIKIIPYYNGDSKDFSFTDGTATTEETIPDAFRMNRIFDNFGTGTRINLFVNGSKIDMFPVDSVGSDGFFPLDLDIDNIYYKYSEKITTLSLQVNSVYLNDIAAGTVTFPNVKVMLQCYIF